MSTPTFRLPANYSSIKWGNPTMTEATTFAGVAIVKSFRYRNPMERIKIEGNQGFVAGFVDMKATSAGTGGTKFDTEQVDLALLHGEHASKTWPVVGDVVTWSGLTGDDAKYNGDWSVVSENADFARKQDGEKGYTLERYADVDLTP